MDEGGEVDNENDKSKDREKCSSIPDGDYVEKRKFCFCFSFRTGLILICVLLIFNFCFLLIDAAGASMNDTFQPIFPLIYWIILGIFFIAVILAYIFQCANDNPTTRSLIPWSFLVAAICNGLVFIWIIVYFTSIYPRDKVYIPRYDNRVDEDDEDMGMKLSRGHGYGHSSSKYTK